MNLDQFTTIRCYHKKNASVQLHVFRVLTYLTNATDAIDVVDITGRNAFIYSAKVIVIGEAFM
ncbi:hypothetical protein RirG_234920 [Rhizophagus irregularis DAOM 197198w]|uniref:Uncharacterized protein n=1 Tax=Rhizophagus irregularis (strain DAOM 197198w) TaxID=1432141 RepID=A0A015K4P7_RHIIW|nr:hypothetical protein RirG_234920 [Rhizophagus irregularis DAOM 197198w]